MTHHTKRNHDAGSRFFARTAPFFRGTTRILVPEEVRLAGFAVGVGWVYCFLSRREGVSEELVSGGGQIPFFEQPVNGSLVWRAGIGWGWF